MPGALADIQVSFEGLPPAASRVLLRHYRIDENHSNSYTVWKQIGSPQSPTPEQYSRLEAAGQLELLESPRWLRSNKGSVDVKFALPRQGVSLLELSW